MEESANELLIEVLHMYGLPGLIISLFMIITVIILYKVGIKHLDNYLDNRIKEREKEHDNRLNKKIKDGPRIYKLLRDYISIVNCDHIFIGEFHNGSTSIAGIPYLKFDILYEHIDSRFHGEDPSLSKRYDNEHIEIHDQLPDMLFFNHSLSYTVEEIKSIDEELYRRMIKNGVKYLALNILTDNKNKPIGFVGGINFNEQQVCNVDELKECAHQIEKIYNE